MRIKWCHFLVWLGTSPPAISHGHLKPLHGESMIFLKALCMKLVFEIWCFSVLSFSPYHTIFFFTLSVFLWLQYSFYCFPSSSHSFSSQPVDHIYHFSSFSFLPVFVHSFIQRKPGSALISPLSVSSPLSTVSLFLSRSLSLFSPFLLCHSDYQSSYLSLLSEHYLSLSQINILITGPA